MTLEKIGTKTKLVWWPSPQDYNEAVQNPDANFGSEQLRGSSIFVGTLGLPRPVCGAFASVYRIRAADETEYAVRCFLRNISDQQARYELITSFVQTDSLPYTVGFEFVPNGIKIRSDWFPILKMDWVTGQTLEQFVISNISNSSAIIDIATKFVSMCHELREAGIAHGDLQHGNILVTESGELRLVDYDGMYVPAMEGFHANELGHRNYQHPGRIASHFGPYLDNFSAWVIYASLKILSLDSSLLAQLRGGDESLLFKRTDFENPMVSQRFAILEAHENDQISKLAKMVRYCLTLPVDSVPAFTETLPEINLPPLPAPIRTVDSTAVGFNGALPEWLRDDPALKPNLPDWMIQEPGRFVQPVAKKAVVTFETELMQPVPRKTDADGEALDAVDPRHVVGMLIGFLWLIQSVKVSLFLLVFIVVLVVVPLILNKYKKQFARKRNRDIVQEGICVQGEVVDITPTSYRLVFTTASGQRVECYREFSDPRDANVIRNATKPLTIIYGAEPAKDAVVYCLSKVKAVRK